MTTLSEGQTNRAAFAPLKKKKQEKNNLCQIEKARENFKCRQCWTQRWMGTVINTVIARLQSYSGKHRSNRRLQPNLFSIDGWKIFIGIIVYKTKTMRKPINFLIVNWTWPCPILLFTIFLLPWSLTELNVGSWLISGPLGQALRKLALFLQDISLTVSTQSLVLIAVDRFGAVVFPLRPPLNSSPRQTASGSPRMG